MHLDGHGAIVEGDESRGVVYDIAIGVDADGHLSWGGSYIAVDGGAPASGGCRRTIRLEDGREFAIEIVNAGRSWGQFVGIDGPPTPAPGPVSRSSPSRASLP